jgi:hypothetical protein
MTRYCRSVLKMACAAGIILLFLAAPHVLTAQETPKGGSDVKQLNDRVELLEQTIKELKDQLTAIEEAKKNPKVEVIDATYKGDSSTPIGTLTTGSTAVPAKKKAEDVNDTTFEIYGFAMLDAGYQFGSNHPDWFDTLRVTQLPSFKDQYGEGGKTYWGVRQSRLGVKSSTPTKYGDLKTVFEFELFGTGVDAGQTTFRLRHAYGELGRVGAGQYWSVTNDTDVFPNSFEYWGPPGIPWYRNVGVRFFALKGKNSVTIGLERPGASGDAGRVGQRVEGLGGVTSKFRWPDLVGNARWDRDWGHIQVSGMLRSIQWRDNNTSDNFDLGGSAVGVGGTVSSSLNFRKNDVGRFSVTYGQGIQNYFNDAPADVGAEIRLGDPRRPFKGVALPIFGMSAFLDHRWNEKFTTAIGYSMIDIQNSNAQAPNAFRQGLYALSNLAWYPVPNVMIGGELQWGRRENFSDGFRSQDFRIQFAFKYNFSKMFKF